MPALAPCGPHLTLSRFDARVAIEFTVPHSCLFAVGRPYHGAERHPASRQRDGAAGEGGRSEDSSLANKWAESAPPNQDILAGYVHFRDGDKRTRGNPPEGAVQDCTGICAVYGTWDNRKSVTQMRHMDGTPGLQSCTAVHLVPSLCT